jgi:hypothetical protein
VKQVLDGLKMMIELNGKRVLAPMFGEKTTHCPRNGDWDVLIQYHWTALSSGKGVERDDRF